MKAVEARLRQEERRIEGEAKERYEQRLRRDREATVYYVQRTDGLIKIGFTGGPLPYRLTALRREHGPLEVLATHKGGRDGERAQHQRFDHLRVTGEWFRPEPELLEHIERIRVRRSQAEGSAA